MTITAAPQDEMPKNPWRKLVQGVLSNPVPKKSHWCDGWKLILISAGKVGHGGNEDFVELSKAVNFTLQIPKKNRLKAILIFTDPFCNIPHSPNKKFCGSEVFHARESRFTLRAKIVTRIRTPHLGRQAVP